MMSTRQSLLSTAGGALVTALVALPAAASAQSQPAPSAARPSQEKALDGAGLHDRAVGAPVVGARAYAQAGATRPADQVAGQAQPPAGDIRNQTMTPGVDQDSELSAAPEQPSEATEEGTVDAVVVTGSRIRRRDLTSAQPIQIISSETIDEKGFTNVAEALNEIPSSGVPVSPIGGQAGFGVGRNFINIFNLGTNRTLTLVNGRRFVGGNVSSIFSGAGAGGQVDLNQIPTALVDRIETIQATGGAIYGSDAVAGVINIITKREFEGLELNGEYGRAEVGDGELYRARITAGRNFLNDRLNLAGSYEYSETSAISNANRAVTANQLVFGANPQNRTPTDGIPGNIIFLDRRIPELTAGGLPTRTGGIAISGILTVPDPANPANRVPAQFAPDGTLVPFNPGQFVQATIASGGDGLNLAPLGSLQAPVQRHVGTAFARYDLTENLRLTGELFASRFESSQDFAQPTFNSGIFGAAGTQSGPLPFSTANPFLTPQARAAILAQPTPLPADPASPGNRLFFLQRASTDITDPRTEAEGDSLRGVINLEGDFRLLNRDFYFNVAANRGKSTGSFRSDNIVQQRFVRAVDVIAGPGGQPICRPTPLAPGEDPSNAADCRPLNLFGSGAPSQEALNFIGVGFESEFEINQTTYEANLGGTLFELPGGPVSFNLGYEYRKEESTFSPNEPQRLGVGRSAAISGLQGEFDTNEYYAEVVVPITGENFNFFGARRLEIEGSYRSVDNSISGKDEAYSYGLRWYPVEDLLIRGTRSRSFRNPAITELFSPTATAFVSAAVDPCDRNNIGAGPNPTARTANCRAAFVALGLPADFQLVSQVQNATVQGTNSGNLDLANEIADQYTLGFVYQPSYARGLAVTLDYVDIELTEGIFSFGLTSILQVCFDSPTPPAAVCNLFQRGRAGTGQDGQVLGTNTLPGSIGPRTGFVNAGFINFAGFVFGLNYGLDLDRLPELAGLFGGDPGRLSFDFDLFTVEEQETSVSGLGFDLNDTRNVIGNADLRWKLDVNYVRAPFSVLLTTRYIGESEFNRTFTPETRLPLSVEDYFLNDLNIGYDLSSLVGDDRLKSLNARLSIRNLLDKEPPFGATTSASGISGTYDLIGRYYQIGVTAKF